MICDIFVETSLNFGQRANGIVGIALQVEDLEAKTVFGTVKNCSQCQAVLIGLKNALTYTNCEELRIHISNYAVGNALNNGWLDRWEQNLFVGSSKKVIKNAKEWHELHNAIKGRKIEIHLNEFNGFRNWLIYESKRRMDKHARIFSVLGKVQTEV